MFEKILVCLDGSKAAEQILPSITSEASRLKSKLVLLRVVSLPEVTVPISVPGVPGGPVNTEGTLKQVQSRQKDAEDYLKLIALSLQQQGLDVEYAVVPGMSGEAIVDYAAGNDITLITIGTHGHNFARRFFLGSTADYVIRHTTVPVLTIRPLQ
jgi:nucleotide-binding universal stress UspA family protein